MKILLLFVLFTLCAVGVYSQSVLPLQADTVVVRKTGGNANFKLQDAGRDSMGVYYNIGGGVFRNKRVRKINDTSFIIGNDTIRMSSSGGASSPLTNASATGDTLLISNTIKRLEAGYGINRTVTATKISDVVDTTSTNHVVTQSDLNDAIGGATISDKYVAYVDSSGNDGTGQVNNPAKKFRTLNGALDGSVGLFSCIIQIGTGRFNSPDSAKMRSNIWFRGSGMPAANDTVTVNAYYNNTVMTATKLIGGTILQGSFMIPFNRENITMTDMGIDVGSDWVTNVNSGVEVDGMLCAQFFNNAGGLSSADGKHHLQTQTKPRRNMQWQNIRVLLPSPTSPVHAFLVENSINERFDNIYTTGGFAGIVIKTIGGIGTNLHTRNHGTYHIILKSNDYSHCYGVVINGFECSTSGTGVTLDQGDAGSPGIYWSNISNGFINLTGGGLSLTGDNMNISNINIVQGGSVLSSALIRSSVSNVVNRLSSGAGYDIDPGSVVATSGTTWSNCTAIGSTSHGFYVHGGSARNDFESIISGENTGYGFNTNGAAYVGSHTYYSNTAGATLGTVNVRNNSITDGHTGNTSFTAYGVIAGGTTSTGALQQVSGVGTSGHVLTSNGAGALPTWQAGGSSNFANSDLDFTGDRSHNAKGFSLQVDSINTLNLLSKGALFSRNTRTQLRFIPDASTPLYINTTLLTADGLSDSASITIDAVSATGLRLTAANTALNRNASIIMNSSGSAGLKSNISLRSDSLAISAIPAASADSGLGIGTYDATNNTNPVLKVAIQRTLKGTTNWTPGIVSAGSSATTTLTVTGAALGDPVTISKVSGAYSNGELYDAFVSATNTVTIRVHNVSTGSANYNTAEDYNVKVLKY